MRDHDDNITYNDYDALGRRLQRKHPDAGITKWAYDKTGNVLSFHPEHIENPIEYEYEYSRLTKVKYPNNPHNNVSYEYGAPGAENNGAGRLVKQADGTGAQIFAYGDMGELTRNLRTVVVPDKGKYSFLTVWEYDSWNRLTAMYYPDGEELSYEYNSGGQMIAMKGKKGANNYQYVKSIGYDKFGNRQYIGYGNGTQASYQYDAQNLRMTALQTTTANGRLIQNNSYIYDAVGNILSLTYNAMQQRQSKRETKNNGDITETFYAYDATGVLMATYTHSRKTGNSTVTLNDFMLYGSSRLGSYVVNEPAGGTAPVPLLAANLRFELTDHLGTVRAVVTGQKTGTGSAEIVSLTDYYPYGMDMPGRSFMAEAYRYGYQGSERDPEMSGGAGYTTFFRALDPRIGRWLTPDPKVFPWQSSYVSMDGNPVALIDPWGASTGGDGDFKTGKGSGSGTSADPYYTHGNITEGSFILSDITVLPTNVNTPANYAFVNIAQSFIPNLAQTQQLQTGIEYERNISWLNKISGWLRRMDSMGNGSYTNWNGDNLFQFYNPGGGGFGSGIHVSGRPTLVDVNTLPFQMGVTGGFGRVGRLNGRPYIRRVGSNAAVSFGLDVSKIVQNASSGFDVGSQLAGAIESVAGKGGAENKPVVRIATDASIESKAESAGRQLMSSKDIPNSVAIREVSVFTLLKKSNGGVAYRDSNNIRAPHDTVWVYSELNEGKKVIEYLTSDRDTIPEGYHYNNWYE